MERGRSWRWSNIPIPEPHVLGLLAGMVFHAFKPSQLTRNQALRWIGGWSLISFSVLVIGWAVRTVGDTDSEGPTTVVTTGPYAFSRNPMYVAWTTLYLGITVIVNTVWLVILLPFVMIATHSIVRREERSMQHAFGDEYRKYRQTVRRYL